MAPQAISRARARPRPTRGGQRRRHMLRQILGDQTRPGCAAPRGVQPDRRQPPPRTRARLAPAARRSAPPARRRCRPWPAPAALRPGSPRGRPVPRRPCRHPSAGPRHRSARWRPGRGPSRSPRVGRTGGELAVVRRQHAMRRASAANSASRSSAKLVSASASRTVARPAASTASASARVPSPTPAPGPDQHASGSAASASSVAQAVGIRDRLGHHRRELGGVGGQRARPAGDADQARPRRASAAMAARRAAPVVATGPPTTSAWPKRYLWLSAVRTGR